jgi:hypothetical protein
VEEDDWGNLKTRGHSLENLQQIPSLQALFDSYGAIPTYLIDFPVSRDEKSRKIFLNILEKGRCEIGAHCHPWNTPPLEEDLNERNSMLCNLPPDLVARKLETLHESIDRGFQSAPKSFRAGRWGFGPDVANCLESLGYGFDTSITPFTDWKIYQGPDFSEASPFPYRFASRNAFQEDTGGVLQEIPPTIGFLQKNFPLRNRIRRKIMNGPLSRMRLIGLLDKLNLLSLRWLSPEMSSGKDMVRLSQAVIESGNPVLNLSFHSTSLLPSKGPFTQTEEDVKNFLRDIRMFLEFVRNQGMEFAPLSKGVQATR